MQCLCCFFYICKQLSLYRQRLSTQNTCFVFYSLSPFLSHKRMPSCPLRIHVQTNKVLSRYELQQGTFSLAVNIFLKSPVPSLLCFFKPRFSVRQLFLLTLHFAPVVISIVICFLPTIMKQAQCLSPLSQLPGHSAIAEEQNSILLLIIALDNSIKLQAIWLVPSGHVPSSRGLTKGKTEEFKREKK